MTRVEIVCGNAMDVLRRMPEDSANCCVTSPPYWGGLRDYGHSDQIGVESMPDEYIAKLVMIFTEVRRVVRADGTLWVVIGDCAKNKNLVGIPWMLAFALRANGWHLRSEIVWHKKNCMPESVKDRPTRSHETIFLLARSERYYYDADAIAEPCVYGDHRRHGGSPPVHAQGQTEQRGLSNLRGNGGAGSGPIADKQRGHVRRHAGFNERWDGLSHEEQRTGKRNKRDVWTVAPSQFAGDHYATFPEALIAPCILAGCPDGGTVLDPFLGAGTTALVAAANGRNAVGVELNPAYVAMARERINKEIGMLVDVSVRQ